MNKIDSSRHAPQAWFDAIDQSEAELAAGQVLDFEEVMREFDAEDAAGLETGATVKPRGFYRHTDG